MEKKDFFWLDGWKSEDRLKLRQNRAFLFGDGFFETMRFFPDGSAFLWPFHWDRIRRSVAALRFLWPEDWTEGAFLALIRTCLPENSGSDLRVKIVFFRAGDGRYAPENTRLAFYLEVEPCQQPWVQLIGRVEKCASVFISKSPFSWIKTTSALPYVMANLERQERGLDDLLLCNENGFVVEGCYSSLCWKKDGVLFFPARELGGFDSCHRRYLEKNWTERGIGFQEVAWTADEVLSSDWICFGGATGLRFIRKEGISLEAEEFRGYPGWE